ncbi:MAG: hypothetical protein U0V74_03200 [Chitinophagales bacterium]
MKKAVLFSFVIVFIASCNFMKQNTDKAKVQLLTHRESADTMRLAGIDTSAIDSLTALIEYGYLSPERSKEILQKVNFSDILGSGTPDAATTFNGFYGTDRYRIEFYVSEVAVDTANPFDIHLQGKCRYKKNITDFTGTVHIDSLFAFKDLSYDYQDFLTYYQGDTSEKFEGDTTIGTYHAKGRFKLDENQNQAGSGSFAGNFFMDFIPSYNENHELTGYNLWYNTRNETLRGGFLFDGSWLSYKGAETKPLLFAADLFMFGNEILKDFSYGEREIEINEKYRSLGWENYWEADEWWNNTPDTKAL